MEREQIFQNFIGEMLEKNIMLLQQTDADIKERKFKRMEAEDKLCSVLKEVIEEHEELIEHFQDAKDSEDFLLLQKIYTKGYTDAIGILKRMNVI